MLPPPQVINMLGLQGERFQAPIRGGLNGLSFIGESYVVQRRAGFMLEHQLIGRKILQSALDEQPGLLTGARSHGPLLGELDGNIFEAETGQDANWIWSASPRLEGELIQARYLSLKQIRERLEQSLEDTRDQLRELARFDGSELLATQPHRGVMVQLASSEWILEMVERRYPNHAHLIRAVENEPKAEVVLSHGDPLLRNIIFTPGQSFLIDFEGLYPLPRDRDWTHMITYLALWTDRPGLKELCEVIFQVAQSELPGWGEDEWRRACAFHMLREAVLWRSLDSEDRKQHYLSQVELMLS